MKVIAWPVQVGLLPADIADDTAGVKLFETVTFAVPDALEQPFAETIKE